MVARIIYVRATKERNWVSVEYYLGLQNDRASCKYCVVGLYLSLGIVGWPGTNLEHFYCCSMQDQQQQCSINAEV